VKFDTRVPCGLPVACTTDVLKPQNRNRRKLDRARTKLAERGGFEPPVGYKPTHAFQACALNHSAISPSLEEMWRPAQNEATIFKESTSRVQGPRQRIGPISKHAISAPLRTRILPAPRAGTFQVFPCKAGTRANSVHFSGVAVTSARSPFAHWIMR
jgi:hypothetical protein